MIIGVVADDVDAGGIVAVFVYIASNVAVVVGLQRSSL